MNADTHQGNGHHARSAWITYFTEWDPVRYPGGLLGVLTFFEMLALFGAGTPFSVLLLAVSIPAMIYSARRALFTICLVVLFSTLHIIYWVVTHKREYVLFEERFMVALNLAACYVCFASSILFPHQYGSRERPEHYKIELATLHCAIPIFSSQGYGHDDSAPLSQQL